MSELVLFNNSVEPLHKWLIHEQVSEIHFKTCGKPISYLMCPHPRECELYWCFSTDLMRFPKLTRIRIMHTVLGKWVYQVYSWSLLYQSFSSLCTVQAQSSVLQSKMLVPMATVGTGSTPPQPISLVGPPLPVQNGTQPGSKVDRLELLSWYMNEKHLLYLQQMCRIHVLLCFSDHSNCTNACGPNKCASWRISAYWQLVSCLYANGDCHGPWAHPSSDGALDATTYKVLYCPLSL